LRILVTLKPTRRIDYLISSRHGCCKRTCNSGRLGNAISCR
jgi:hypothetical protein